MNYNLSLFVSQMFKVKPTRDNKSVVYRLKKDGLTTDYFCDEKNRNVKRVYNEDKSFVKITKTWIQGGDVYKKTNTFRQYDYRKTKYTKNGELHRKGKPALVRECYKYRPIITIRKWCWNGELHNPDGIAYFYEVDEMYDDDNPHYYCEEEYFLFGKKYSKAEFDRLKLKDELYDCNLCCKDVCGVIASFVY